MICEVYTASDFSEQGVVFAQANIRTRLKASTTLSYKDRPACDQVSVESLNPQPL